MMNRTESAKPVALITGAGRGIGRATAIAFAQEGYDVSLTARTQAQLEATAGECQAAGAKALVLPGDVSDPVSVSRVVGATLDQLGRIDVLVNNAAAFKVAPVAETSIDDWDHMIAVNLRGVFLYTKAVLPHMKARGSGCILNMASMAGKKWYLNQGAYCASKYAVVGLSKVLAAELQHDGIRVTAICPGGVDTELVRAQRHDVDFSDYMRPETIAQVCVFLARLPADAAIDELMVRRWLASPF